MLSCEQRSVPLENWGMSSFCNDISREISNARRLQSIDDETDGNSNFEINAQLSNVASNRVETHVTEGFDALEASYVLSADIGTLSTADVVARLYNYMKISEMDRYGMAVFQTVWRQYMRLLNEDDVNTLVTSYWCNGRHFECVVRHRGWPLRDGSRLKLQLTEGLVNHAMSGGASVEKVRALLAQWRKDLSDVNKSQNLERSFFKRNCQFRFWNMEVCSKAFSLNGWLKSDLAQHALDRFTEQIYARGMLVDIRGDGAMFDSSKTKKVARWSALIQLLAAKGADASDERFSIRPMKEALVCGRNTWRFIQMDVNAKNELLATALGLDMPNELWHELVSYF